MSYARILRWIILVSPTLFAALYFGFVAADRYVSEAQFVVRTASKPVGSSGFGALLQMTGLGRAQDEIFSVQAFMNSRDASDQMAKTLPLREMYGQSTADIITRYPSFIFGDTKEEFHKYLGWMITTIFNSTTSITTLRVQAFRAQDARAVASGLLDLGEQMVNRMNERIQADSVRTAEAEVQRFQDRLVTAQLAITRFRNAELMIDPAGSSILVTELVGKLSAELTETESQLREVAGAASTSPQLPSLRRRADALKQQIVRERQRIASDKDGLADKLEIYERLVLDREFAKQALALAARSMETAQQEGRRQQLYLERIVEPQNADYPMAPERLRTIVTILGFNIALVLIGWLVMSGLREHASQKG